MDKSVEVEQDEEPEAEDGEEDESDERGVDMNEATSGESSWNALHAHSDARIYEFNRGQWIAMFCV